MTFTIVIDLVVIGFLIATLIHALRINKQLSNLYQARGELQSFLEGFTSSLVKAETSMQALRNTGETTFTAVHEALTKAQALRDDLSYLVDRGETIATHLDEAIREARLWHKEMQSYSLPHENNKTSPAHTQENEFLKQLRTVR
jgi:hypothetical protein